MRILIFGASGYIGTNLVPQLLLAQVPGLLLRASSRNSKVLEARAWQGVELVQADALRPQTLGPALAGVDVAYYLVHSMASGKGFDQLDLDAARNFAAAAVTAGVGRVIYLGGLIPPDSRSPHLRSRAATGEVLRSAGLPVIELRAGIIVGPGSAAFEVMRDLVNHLPVMITPRWVRAQCSPIALSNLIRYLVEFGLSDSAQPAIYDVGGPEVVSYQQMMLAIGHRTGKRPLIIPVPLLSPGLSSWWLRLVTSVPTPIAKALIAGLEHDFVADSSAIEQRCPQRLLSFEEALDEVERVERDNAVPAQWVEGAFPIRDYNPAYGFYAKKAGGSAVSSASAATCWRVVQTIGGDQGYFYLNPLWRLRELLDWCVGGKGLRHQRRDPARLRLGDVVDSWRVIGLQEERRLTLKFGMKAPGAGVLEFELEQQPEGCRVTATAYWHPAGVWGLLYWYALIPAHLVIFKGMTEAIAAQAEALQRAEQGAGAG